MTPALRADLASAIHAARGIPFACVRDSPQRGGCIHQGYSLTGADGSRYFAKLNHADRLDQFEAEADGLRELSAVGAIRVPWPVACGVSGDMAYLIMEWLDLAGKGRPAALGHGLARLHGQTAENFGWWRDNHIGSTPQRNSLMSGWVDFYRTRRLAVQFDLAQRNGAAHGLLRRGDRLLAHLDAFFPGYHPAPSLLHGDLWAGNHGYVAGEPVLFDPAVYHGDREADLAMTELFGGYPPEFYAAYREAWPLDPGYRVRKHLYNLYHILNHFNLFGSGYAAQAERMVDQLLAEIG